MAPSGSAVNVPFDPGTIPDDKTTRQAAKLRPLSPANLDYAQELAQIPIVRANVATGPRVQAVPVWAMKVIHWYALAKAVDPKSEIPRTVFMLNRAIDRLKTSPDLQDALLAVEALAPPGDRFSAVGAWLATVARG